jgi:hypothetical protein
MSKTNHTLWYHLLGMGDGVADERAPQREQKAAAASSDAPQDAQDRVSNGAISDRIVRLP